MLRKRSEEISDNFPHFLITFLATMLPMFSSHWKLVILLILMIRMIMVICYSVEYSDYGDAVETGYFDETGDCGEY